MSDERNGRDELLRDLYASGSNAQTDRPALPLQAARRARSLRRMRRAMLTTFGAGATGVALWLLSPHGAPEIKTETDGIAGAQVVDPEAVSYAVINSEAAVYSTVSNENLQEALAGVPVLLIHEPNGGLRVVVLN